jgi:hypothetical protein
MDSIVQIGLCLVRSCEVVHDYFDEDFKSITIKLPREKFVGKEQAIAVHGIDYEKSQATGVEPQEAYKLLYDIVMDATNKGMYVCGHNLYSFDIPFFQTELKRMGIDFKFMPTMIVDTAMLVKAMQVGMMPGERESVYSYWSRIREFRAKGVFFSLDRFCIDRFGLNTRYGVNKAEAHDAGYDCWLTHLVVTEMNRIITA